MNKIILILIVVLYPVMTYAQGLQLGCCEGLADNITTGMTSKFSLYAESVCKDGTAMRQISFSHNKDENLTYQESFGLECVQSDSIVTTDCQWQSPLKSNFKLQTDYPASIKSVIVGVRFYHNFGENLTYQQSYTIKTCALMHPQTRNPANGQPGTGTPKWYLQSTAKCDRTNAGKTTGVAISIGFSHPQDMNGTHQETVMLHCSND